jgi:dTDP-4-dehydrorhamnose reductase
MRVFVTGARGQLGRALMLQLAGPEAVGVDLPEVDVTDETAIRQAIAMARPTVVIHAAAMTDVDGAAREPEQAYRVNAIGTRNVAMAAEERGATLAVVSTNEVFD